MLDRTAEALDVVTPGLLKAFGGARIITPYGPLVEKGAYYVGVEDHGRASGIFFHVLLVSRVAYFLTKELKEKAPERFGSLDYVSVIHTALTHDITKVYAQDREGLSPEAKQALGIRADFSETDPEVEEIGVGWLRELGFPAEVYENIVDHFPVQIRESDCWKIVLLSDYMAGQKIMTPDERLDDVEERWINLLLRQQKKPKIDPAVFNLAKITIKDVANEKFAILGMTAAEFIDKHGLNLPEVSQQPWEKFFMDTWLLKKRISDRVQQVTMEILGIDSADVDAKAQLNRAMCANATQYTAAYNEACIRVTGPLVQVLE